jgi:hypothetical protein
MMINSNLKITFFWVYNPKMYNVSLYSILNESAEETVLDGI